MGHKIIFLFLGIFLIALAQNASALTAQEIADSVIDELNNLSDYQATADIDYENPLLNDMSGGILKWKRNSGTWMSKFIMGSPFTGEIRTDGTTGYNSWNVDDDLFYFPISDGDTWVTANWGANLFNTEKVLQGQSWSKDNNTYTVNSVQCYRLYSSFYEVWIDTATVKKVIRTKMYNGSGLTDLLWQFDYNDYSNVENTVLLPSTFVAKRYEDNVLYGTGTLTFGNIDINEGISDSLFEIAHP